MRVDDLVLAMTVRALNASEGEFETLVKTLETKFTGPDLQTPRSPQKVSIGAIENNGNEVGLLPWLRSQRSMGQVRASVVMISPEQMEGLPEHVREAFSGGNPRFIQVIRGNNAEIYTLGMLASPQVWVTKEDLVNLIDSQATPQPIWQAVADRVSETLKANKQPAISAKDVKGLMLSSQGDELMQFLLPEVLNAIQSRAKLMGRPLVIPDEMQKFFDTAGAIPDPVFGDAAVSEEEALHFTVAPTREDLVELFNAQKGRDELWGAFFGSLAMSGLINPEAIGQGTPEQLLATLPEEQFEMFKGASLRELQSLARRHDATFIVPDSLKPKLKTLMEGMSPVEKAAYVPSGDRLVPKPNPEPWEFWCWHVVGQSRPVEAEDKIDDARAELRQAVSVIKDFATQIGSPFEQAFGLALYVMDHPPLKLLKSELTEQTLLEGIGSMPLTGQQKSALARYLSSAAGVSLLGYSDEALELFLAVSIADVFGGAGSWNDQQLAEVHHREYQQVSARLFMAIMRAKLAAVNSSISRLILF